MLRILFRFFFLASVVGLLAGCSSFSATALRCGSDARGGSFVELVNLPQDLSGQIRNYALLCGFIYEGNPE